MIYHAFTSMKLTTRVSLHDHEQSLMRLVLEANRMCNLISEVAFASRTFAHRKLRALVYESMRLDGWNCGPSDLLPKKVAAEFKPLGGIPIDKRSYSYKRDNMVRIWTPDGFVLCRFEARPDIMLSNKFPATLCVAGDRFFLEQVIEVHESPLINPTTWLGVDLGIVNIATDSDGQVFSGANLNGLRILHLGFGPKHQRKHTTAAGGGLRGRRRKEKLFARDVNHKIARSMVNKARDTGRGIALEDLKGIRDRITVRRAQRDTFGSWAFFQLRSFVEYKAALAGVEVRVVDPRNTSRTCPHCGHVDKKNRPSQAEFRCIRCGFAGRADHVAARNIAGRAPGLGQTRRQDVHGRETKSMAVICESSEDRHE